MSVFRGQEVDVFSLPQAIYTVSKIRGQFDSLIQGQKIHFGFIVVFLEKNIPAFVFPLIVEVLLFR